MAAAATTAAYKEEPNPSGRGSGGFCPPVPPASTEVDSSAWSQNSNRMTPEQLLQVERQFEKDAWQIHRKRCMLLSLALHLAVLVLGNAVTWAAWAYTRSSGSQSQPAVWQPGGALRPQPNEAEDQAGQPDQFLPPGVRGEIYEYPHAPCPWPAWVTFGTLTLFFFHAVNLLPLIITKRPSGCPPWNYWVFANMAGVVGVLWAVFLLTGGLEYHEFPWPIIFTIVALGTCLITTAISCLSGVMKRYVEGI